jgi:hypothetical protein
MVVQDTAGGAAVVQQIYNTATAPNSRAIFQLNVGGANYINLVNDYTGQYFQIVGSSITTKYEDFDTQYWRNNAGTTELLKLTAASLNVSSNLNVTGSANISGNLSVSKETTISGNISVTKNATVTGILAVTGNTNLSGNLSVSKDAAMSGNLSIGGSINVASSISIGGAPDSAVSLKVSKNITGGPVSWGVLSNGIVQSDVNQTAAGYLSQIGTATGATPNVAHFHAAQGTLTGTPFIQYGFLAGGTALIGATKNYQFYASNQEAITAGKTAYAYYTSQNLPTGGGTTYAFYASGTANSYFGGNIGIGDTTPTYPISITTDTNPIVATTSATNGISISSTESTASGINITFNKYSSSPTNGDSIALIRSYGKNSTGISTEYSRITTRVMTVTNGAENSVIYLAVQSEGALNNKVTICNTGISCGDTYTGVVTASPKQIYVDNTGKYGVLVSSLRYKENIKNIPYGLNEVMRLRSVTYNYKGNSDDFLALGFIAEEIDEIGIKESIYYKDGQPDALNYESFIPILTKAIQEQQVMIQDLKNEVANLKIQITSS